MDHYFLEGVISTHKFYLNINIMATASRNDFMKTEHSQSQRIFLGLLLSFFYSYFMIFV